MKFLDRSEAGKLLAEKLSLYTHQKNVIVLGLPRGGIPVAVEVAKKLHAPLDALLVKKIGMPGNDELAVGAIAYHYPPVFNTGLVSRVSSVVLQSIIEEKKQALADRNHQYRHDKPPPAVENKIVIIVDDGIATGASLRAALSALAYQHPAKIIIAVPVADAFVCDELSKMVDEVVCLFQPETLIAVGQFYENFDQVSDQEVIKILS